MTDKSIGYVFQFAANVADGMSMTINGNFPLGAAKADMDAEIDKLRSVAERQRAKNEIKLLDATITETEKRLRNAKFDLGEYLKDSKHQDGDAHSSRMREVIKELTDDLQRGVEQMQDTLAKAA